MGGSVCSYGFPVTLERMGDILPDIILAVCDVEGNFLVVKVSPLARTLIFYGVTNLNTTGLSIYQPPFVHAPRCVSLASAEPLLP